MRQTSSLRQKKTYQRHPVLTNLSRKRDKLRRNAFGLDDRILRAKTHSPRQPRFALQPAKREWHWAGAGGGANEKNHAVWRGFRWIHPTILNLEFLYVISPKLSAHLFFAAYK